MIWFLLFLFLIPIIEIWLLIKIGGWIGPWTTVGLVILTALLGGLLARREGLQAYRLAQIQLRNGEVPGEAILDGFCILIGAVLLLVPGFLTDVIGLFFFLPLTRAVMKQMIKRWLKQRVETGHQTFFWFNIKR